MQGIGNASDTIAGDEAYYEYVGSKKKHKTLLIRTVNSQKGTFFQVKEDNRIL